MTLTLNPTRLATTEPSDHNGGDANPPSAQTRARSRAPTLEPIPNRSLDHEEPRFKMHTAKSPEVKALTASIVKAQRASTSVVTVGHFSPLTLSLLALCRTSFLEQGIARAPSSDIFKWIVGYLNLLKSDTLKRQFLNEIPNSRSLGRNLSAASLLPVDRTGMITENDKYGNRRFYLFKQQKDNSRGSYLDAETAEKNIRLLATGKVVIED